MLSQFVQSSNFFLSSLNTGVSSEAIFCSCNLGTSLVQSRFEMLTVRCFKARTANNEPAFRFGIYFTGPLTPYISGLT